MLSSPANIVSITLTLRILNYHTLLQYRQDIFFRRQKGSSNCKGSSNINRLKTVHNQQGNFISKYLTSESNLQELNTCQTFRRTKHFAGVKLRFHRSDITRDQILRIPIFQKKFNDFFNPTSILLSEQIISVQ